MKAKSNLFLLGILSMMLVACASTDSTDGNGGDLGAGDVESADAPTVAPPTVVNTAPTTPTMTVDQTYIGGTSMANGGALVEIEDTVLYFGFDLSTLTPQARASLTRIAASLRTSTGSVRLEGHADERGTREYNIALGERRAKAVADFLVLQGVSASRLETISYGEERPAVSGTGESVWSQNRRVEIK